MAQSAETIRGMKAARPSALELFMQQRRIAEASQGPEMTLDEINAEIRVARKERQRLGDGNREALATDRDAKTSGMRLEKQQTV